MQKHCIGVIGTGTMGRGIIQLFAQTGHEVRFYDATPGAAEKASFEVATMLQRGVKKGKWSVGELDAMRASMRVCASLAEFAECHVIIEAIIEELAAKTALFAQLEAEISSSCILATNTSSLLVSAIAAGCKHPERVAGLHFFNPVPLMKVAEVIAGVRTAASTVSILKALIGDTGHRAVVATDQPGFLINHAGRGLYTEGLRIVEESVASVSDVDTVLKSAMGFRMGPFELLDLTGLDVSGKVMQSIYDQFHQEPRFRPSSLVAPRIAAGLFGRKSARGWYAYADDKKEAIVARSYAAGRSGLRVWVDPASDEYASLRLMLREHAVEEVKDAAHAELIIVQCWGTDVSTYCVDRRLDASRCVAVDPLPGLSRHRTLMLSAVTCAEARDAAAGLFADDDIGITVINDSCGFIAQRVLATIVNIASDLAQRGIASVPDIEDGVTLGLGYPLGPLAWGDRIGPARIMEILSKLRASTGDPRYRPSPWLRRRAALGASLLSLEPQRSDHDHH